MALTCPRVAETTSAQVNTTQVSKIQYLHQKHIISDLSMLQEESGRHIYYLQVL